MLHRPTGQPTLSGVAAFLLSRPWQLPRFCVHLSSRRSLKQLVDAFRAHSDFPAESLATFEFIPGVAWSDHVSFWRQGYRAVMVTDTAFYRYAYYHTARDTPEKLNYAAMGRVVDGLQQTLVVLAG
ncbi:MAG TPA: M28 family peptidase [Casimicrobiaceae bacterium]|nr:M28 family peptidase [Casimicrobiaceae bacterium]